MTVDQIISLITNPDSVRIFRDGKEIFTGYVGILINHDIGIQIQYRRIKNLEVRSLRTKLDITHREWKEKGLQAPLESDRLPEYSFSDLQMRLYYEIYT